MADSAWDECRRVCDALNARLDGHDLELGVDWRASARGLAFPHCVAFVVRRLRPYGRLYDMAAGWGVDREDAAGRLLEKFASRPEWPVHDATRGICVKVKSAGSASELRLRMAAEEGV